MKNLDDIFVDLENSKFRSEFKLKGPEADYLKQKDLHTILQHAPDFSTYRIAPPNPPKDGRQTPMKNHTIFIARQPTAFCCRNYLQKWRNIPKGKALSQDEIDYIVSVIGYWLKNHKI
jgi:hypothetical protein